MAFEKGVSGNPSGRPKGRTIAKGIRERMAADDAYWNHVDKQIALANEGNAKAQETVRAALDGPAEQKLSIDAMLTSMTPEQKLEVMLAAKAQLEAMESDEDSETEAPV